MSAETARPAGTTNANASSRPVGRSVASLAAKGMEKITRPLASRASTWCGPGGGAVRSAASTSKRRLEHQARRRDAPPDQEPPTDGPADRLTDRVVRSRLPERHHRRPVVVAHPVGIAVAHEVEVRRRVLRAERRRRRAPRCRCCRPGADIPNRDHLPRRSPHGFGPCCDPPRAPSRPTRSASGPIPEPFGRRHLRTRCRRSRSSSPSSPRRSSTACSRRPP